jgi:hypothetical protein
VASSILQVRPPFSSPPAGAAVPAAQAERATTVAFSADGAKGVSDVGIVSQASPGSEEEIVQEGNAAEQPETAHGLTMSDLGKLAAQQGGLLMGALPIDLTNLNGAVDEFFGRFEELAADGWALSAKGQMVSWVLAAVVATGAFEFARRRLASSEPNLLSEENDTVSWAPSTVLALLPSEEVS